MNARFFLLVLCGLALASCAPPVTQAGDPTGVATDTAVPTFSGMPNPAAVFCKQKGYRYEMVTAADGSQSANCIFPDGSKCEEWAYFRGECQPGARQTTPAAVTQPTPSAAALEPTVPASAVPLHSTPAPTVLRVAYWGAGQVQL